MSAEPDRTPASLRVCAPAQVLHPRVGVQTGGCADCPGISELVTLVDVLVLLVLHEPTCPSYRGLTR